MKAAICLAGLLGFVSFRVNGGQSCEIAPGHPYHRLVSCTIALDSIGIPNTVLAPYRDGGFLGGYTFDDVDLAWTPHSPTYVTGAGWIVEFPVPMTNAVCFNDPTNGPVLPLTIPLTVGPNIVHVALNLVSCQSNIVAGYEDIVGRPPADQTLLFKLNNGGHALHFQTNTPYYPAAPDYAQFGYTNGVWSPAIPIMDIGEACWVYELTPFVYRPVALNPRVENTHFAFELETVYGKSVTIEYAEFLPAPGWQELTTFVGDGHRKTVRDDNETASHTQRFYRIRSSAP
jgi:hypothetical protein